VSFPLDDVPGDVGERGLGGIYGGHPPGFLGLAF
jgi:hypothetical protein